MARRYVFDIICAEYHNIRVSWVVEIGDEFEPEFFALPDEVRTEILALARLLQQFGPELGRPRVDTLNGSCLAAEGEWPLLSIGSAGPYCSLPGTNRASAKSGSTAS
jgi:hypothetical protein